MWKSREFPRYRERYRRFRRNFWRNAAANSFIRAAEGKSSRTWTSVGIVASTLHVLTRANERKKRILWRGRLRTGETLKISQSIEDKR